MTPSFRVIYTDFMDRQAIIKKHLIQVSRQSYWLGIGIGLLLGIIAGFALGYASGSSTTIVVPLSEGVKV